MDIVTEGDEDLEQNLDISLSPRNLPAPAVVRGV